MKNPSRVRVGGPWQERQALGTIVAAGSRHLDAQHVALAGGRHADRDQVAMLRLLMPSAAARSYTQRVDTPPT